MSPCQVFPVQWHCKGSHTLRTELPLLSKFTNSAAATLDRAKTVSSGTSPGASTKAQETQKSKLKPLLFPTCRSLGRNYLIVGDRLTGSRARARVVENTSTGMPYIIGRTVSRSLSIKLLVSGPPSTIALACETLSATEHINNVIPSMMSSLSGNTI